VAEEPPERYPIDMGSKGTRLGAALAAAMLCFSTAAPADAMSSGDERIRIETEATLTAGMASLDIRCTSRYARVYIDSSLAGPAPYSADIAAGIHTVSIEAPGCRPLGITLPLEEKTRYAITFDPARIKGRLFVGLEPASATLTLDGQAVDPGFTELPVGTYVLAARRFGYREERRTVDIRDGDTSFQYFSLERASFEVSDFRSTRESFNPANPGASGRTELAFAATSYGSARAVLLGPGGDLVREIEYPKIEDWDQRAAWDGRAADGAPLPDGVYVARLAASPAPGVPTLPEGPLGSGRSSGQVAADGSIVLETELRIDSSIRVRALGSVQAMPGLLAFPDPLPQPAGTTSLDTAWFASIRDPSSSAFGLSLSSSIAGAAALSFSGAVEPEGRGAADLAASVLVSLLADRASGSGGAAFLRASWSSAAEPSMPESRGSVELSLPWALAAGGLGIGAAPGAALDFSSSEPELLALARAGAWLDSGPLRAGVSGALPFGLGLGSAAAGPRWPARIAAEARLMLGSSPFTASIYALADIAPGSEPRLLAGLGAGLLF
jgi:hypothetical protein